MRQAENPITLAHTPGSSHDGREQVQHESAQVPPQLLRRRAHPHDPSEPPARDPAPSQRQRLHAHGVWWVSPHKGENSLQ